MVRVALGVLCFAAAGGGVLFLWAPEEPVRAAPPAEVRVAGQPIDLAADRAAQAHRIAQAHLHGEVRIRIEDRVIERRRSAFGLTVDTARLDALLADAADPRSPMRRLHARARPGRPLDIPLPLALDVGRLRAMLVELKDELDRPARGPRMDTTTRTLVVEQAGREVDVWATLDRVEEALRTGAEEVEVIVRHEAPDRRLAGLGPVAMRQLLGEMTTRYNRTEDAADRTHNLRVGAMKLDGIILAPNEVLSFNEAVGERSSANGFRPAPVIADGELADGVGGGACQLAGTLHGAAFFAGLTILERHPHSRPSGYIKLGLDATVIYPQRDLRVRNDYPHPVVVELKVEGGEARARIWGVETQRMVSFVRRIERFLPFEERDAEDPTLPAGVRVLSQRGIPGFHVRRFRIVRDMERNQAVRQAAIDVYPPTAQIWRVGTGGPAPAGYRPPAGDDHLEYVADQYLTMTQGPGIEGTQELRRAGRTGNYGWTVREGMPGVPGPAAAEATP
jgi:vancomycin resistance protein YoaR